MGANSMHPTLAAILWPKERRRWALFGVATLSHELRTPLNPMLGWTQLLRARKFDERTTARALETIERNTKLLSQLIEDVLDVSRIITGKLRLNVAPVELARVLELAADTVPPAADAKDIAVFT